ncbi:pumilio 2 [Anaeramoeba flamelloides]|uniref:Pumilio 2 n=1 Tax=Anaeramoeba flamelloides TaxID=1746091 RepID=A0ABQ8Z731_9EUKA|nr:pumilio 2 [Anaeramoeba flamelloides]
MNKRTSQKLSKQPVAKKNMARRQNSLPVKGNKSKVTSNLRINLDNLRISDFSRRLSPRTQLKLLPPTSPRSSFKLLGANSPRNNEEFFTLLSTNNNNSQNQKENNTNTNTSNSKINTNTYNNTNTNTNSNIVNQKYTNKKENKANNQEKPNKQGKTNNQSKPNNQSKTNNYEKKNSQGTEKDQKIPTESPRVYDLVVNEQRSNSAPPSPSFILSPRSKENQTQLPPFFTPRFDLIEQDKKPMQTLSPRLGRDFNFNTKTYVSGTVSARISGTYNGIERGFGLEDNSLKEKKLESIWNKPSTNTKKKKTLKKKKIKHNSNKNKKKKSPKLSKVKNPKKSPTRKKNLKEKKSKSDPQINKLSKNYQNNGFQLNFDSIWHQEKNQQLKDQVFNSNFSNHQEQNSKENNPKEENKTEKFNNYDQTQKKNNNDQENHQKKKLIKVNQVSPLDLQTNQTYFEQKYKKPTSNNHQNQQNSTREINRSNNNVMSKYNYQPNYYHQMRNQQQTKNQNQQQQQLEFQFQNNYQNQEEVLGYSNYPINRNITHQNYQEMNHYYNYPNNNYQVDEMYYVQQNTNQQYIQYQYNQSNNYINNNNQRYQNSLNQNKSYNYYHQQQQQQKQQQQQQQNRRKKQQQKQQNQKKQNQNHKKQSKEIKLTLLHNENSSLLDQFREDPEKFQDFQLSQLYDHILEFSGDQLGSRYIQLRFQTASEEEKEKLFTIIYTNVDYLVRNIFGNYVIQKCLEDGLTNQILILTNLIKESVIKFSLDTYACRVIQKAFQVFGEEDKEFLVDKIGEKALVLVKDQNGNHVIQKCIECLPDKLRSKLVVHIIDYVVPLSTHGFGCRTIQRLLRHYRGQYFETIVQKLLASIKSFIMNQYGNYVVQHLLEFVNEDEQKIPIFNLVNARFIEFSTHKFASNVVEKCLIFGTSKEHKSIVNILKLNNGEILNRIMRDKFGNYVIQRLIEKCDYLIIQPILNILLSKIDDLKSFQYGKHILKKIKLRGYFK